MVVDARAAAAKCKIADAIKTLNPGKASADLIEPESIDLLIMMSKLTRRLTLFSQFPGEVVSEEFCKPLP
jgi:hypothetical protein